MVGGVRCLEPATSSRRRSPRRKQSLSRLAARHPYAAAFGLQKLPIFWDPGQAPPLPTNAQRAGAQCCRVAGLWLSYASLSPPQAPAPAAIGALAGCTCCGPPRFWLAAIGEGIGACASEQGVKTLNSGASWARCGVSTATPGQTANQTRFRKMKGVSTFLDMKLIAGACGKAAHMAKPPPHRCRWRHWQRCAASRLCCGRYRAAAGRAAAAAAAAGAATGAAAAAVWIRCCRRLSCRA